MRGVELDSTAQDIALGARIATRLSILHRRTHAGPVPALSHEILTFTYPLSPTDHRPIAYNRPTAHTPKTW